MVDTPAHSPLEIFTDGSCFPNPGRGGWAFVAVRDGRSIKESFGGEPNTTSCRMELMGILRALHWLPPGASTTIVSDSEYALKVLSGEHRAKANLDLIERAWALIADRLAARGLTSGKRKKRKRPRQRMKKACYTRRTPNYADLRRRAEQDGIPFDDSLPAHLIP